MKGDGGTAFEKARRQVLTGGQNETSPYTTRFSFHINVTNLPHLSLLTCSSLQQTKSRMSSTYEK